MQHRVYITKSDEIAPKEAKGPPKEMKQMKKALLAISAFGAVFALLISGIAMGLEAKEAPEEDLSETGSEQYYEYEDMIDESIDDLGIEDVDEEDNVSAIPRFSNLVSRAYKDLSTGFNSRNMYWSVLPPIKNIHGAEDPHLWMMELLEDIGGDEGVNVTDADNDGNPEKVVIHRRYANTYADVNETSEENVLAEYELAEEIEVTNSTSSVIKRQGGWKFIYVDSDDDGIVESIYLFVKIKATMDIDGNGRPEKLFTFEWSGRAVDSDQDGDWDREGYRIKATYVVDTDEDRLPERRHYHQASYLRIDNGGRPRWDHIFAIAKKGHMIDADSDGNPELIKSNSYRGVWIDRDSDGWPTSMDLVLTSSISKDRDSDGNKEIKERTRSALRFVDRNDDLYPEFVQISYSKVSYFDRDDDGHTDVMRTISRVFTWIDRDSDGIPERVSRTSSDVYQRPARRENDGTSLVDRVKKELEKRDPRKNNDESERDERPDVKPEREEKEPKRE